MEDDAFAWDDDKAARNWRDHGITFEIARDVFRDSFAVEWTDYGHGDPEERVVTVGMVESRLIVVSYTLRGPRIASSRPGWRNPLSDGNTTMKTKHDWVARRRDDRRASPRGGDRRS